MEPLRWVEIGNPVSETRYKLLSKTLTEMGIANELNLVQCDRDQLIQTIEDAKLVSDQILIGPMYTELAFDIRKELTSSILSVKSVDSFSKTPEGKWWPRSLLHDAFIQSLAHKIRALDLNSTALVIGAEGSARAIVAALARVGFSRFNITDRFHERAMVMIQDLKRTHFNMSFEFVPQSAVTALPGIHSVIVNTLPYEANDDLLRELQFFNFLKEGGVYIDLSTNPPQTPLLTEAEQIGTRTIRGDEVATEVDSLWVEQVTGKKLDAVKYGRMLLEALTQTSQYQPPKE